MRSTIASIFETIRVERKLLPFRSLESKLVSTGQIDVIHHYFITGGGRSCHLAQASGFTTFKVAILKILN